MIISDAHCDLPYKALDYKKNISSNDCHWALDKLSDKNTYIQIFASWIDIKATNDPFKRANDMILSFKKDLSNYNEKISLTTKYDEVLDNISKKKTSAILSIEGGEAINGKIENIEYFYNLGVRFMTLTWNNENEIGEGVGDLNQNRGLKPFGFDVIKKMNEVGMTIDVSHLTEKGFWDVAETSNKPFVATHSNSKKICNHKRNLTDDQFKCIVKSGGFAGINLCPLFLNLSDAADVTDIIKHIEHFLSLNGENSIVLGCDFDGIDDIPSDITDISKIEILSNKLAKLNYSDELIAKIMGDNLLQYIKSWLT